MRFIQVWVLASLLGLATGAGAADGQTLQEKDFQAGREYVELPGPPVLAEPDDGRIEVISFFWYGCPNCYAVEADLAAWAAKLPPDVRFIRRPAVFKPPIDFHASIFLALAALGYGPEMDTRVFSIFQDEGRFINTPDELPGLAKDLKIDPRTFVAAFNSPAVQAEMTALDKLMAAYDLPGVPALVVAGKYRFDIGTAHGPAGLIKLADILVEKERRTRGKADRVKAEK